jgi:hypothetical protein
MPAFVGLLIFRMINPQSQLLERPRSVHISPDPNTTTVAFIAGPHIFVRKLHLPESVVNAWLRTYRSKIDKAARKAMKQNPPKNNSQIICISLSEFCTESWKTIFIRTEANPSAVALDWRTHSDDSSGVWSIIGLPESTNVIGGGFGSAPVLSRYLLALQLIYLIGRFYLDICK